MNDGACVRIVAAAGPLDGRAVLEVGPGRGALTKHLVARAARVLALEIDAELAEALRAAFPARLEVIDADATAADWTALADRALAGGLEPPVPLVANLPYESGTAILQRWLEASATDARLDAAVVMLQAEVAERVAARPSTKAYGALAAIAQATHQVGNVLDVSPGSFRPVPKVWSRVIRLQRRADPLFPPSERADHVALVHAAFSQRRKQAAGVLAGFRGVSRERWQECLSALGHPPTARAEELAPHELVALSRLGRV